MPVKILLEFRTFNREKTEYKFYYADLTVALENCLLCQILTLMTKLFL